LKKENGFPLDLKGSMGFSNIKQCQATGRNLFYAEAFFNDTKVAIFRQTHHPPF